ncbi:MAG TPA: SRPBCC domain-containing protein [Candidatus Saccharimonadales bacterium]|nr:SRPBCC domain-containing protein [Candidatus Saccharimonadales bacterium]
MSKTKFEVDKDNLEVRITRPYKATPERLWEAYTDPEQIAQWWRNTTIDKHDFRVGGVWRFVDHGKNGGENHGFRGEFKEIDEPHKIVRTFEYEPWAGHVLTETVTFEAMDDGSTLVTTVSKYQNLDDLEGMVNSGMEKGATAGMERIAELVEQ